MRGMERDVRGETGVVVVFDKVAEEGRIGAVAGDGFDHVVEVADAAAGGFEGVEELPVAVWVSDGSEKVERGDVHGVVENAI